MVFNIKDREGHLWYIPRALVFDNRQRSDGLLALTNRVMGVAKKRPRASLATNESEHIVGTYIPKSKGQQPKQKRKRPKRLAKKLLEIREGLGLSQGGMLRSLGQEDELERDYISKYERGVLEPPLPVLLAYARRAGICVDMLIDDELDLPAKLPAKPQHARR